MSARGMFAKDLFTYLFCMPPTQRPYDWDEDEAHTLLLDLAASLPDQKEEGELYILGTINLAEGPTVASDLRKKYVVDGQQRIVSLCLLFAAARERFLSDLAYTELADELRGYLHQSASRALGHPEQPRVQLLWDEDTRFLERLLLDQAFQASDNGGGPFKGESQPKLWANLQLYRRELCVMDLPHVEALLQYILQRVHFTVTQSAKVSTSLKFFSVSAQRGKQMQAIDHLKAYIFDPTTMPADKQEEYGRRWGELERMQAVECADSLLGRDGISRVCSMLAAVHLRPARGGSSNEFEQLETLYTQLTRGWNGGQGGVGPTGPAFFDTVLQPYCQLYVRMKAGEHRLPGASSDEDRHARYLLTCLNRHRVEEWEPLALAALMQHQLGRLGTAALLVLLADLERLCWMWVLCGLSKHGAKARAKRVAQALAELGLAGPAALSGGTQGSTQASAGHMIPPLVNSVAASLRLTGEEAGTMLQALDGPLYASLGKSQGRVLIKLLVRLNEHYLSASGSTFIQPFDADDRTLTVEHVLPQEYADKRKANNEWAKLFGEQAEIWLHRLGNLMLLHRARNSKASNGSFDEKKRAYRGQHSVYGTTSIPLTDEVMQLAAWTPATAAERQAFVLGIAKSCWRLYEVQGQTLEGEAQAAAVQLQEKLAARQPAGLCDL